jgi:hypothetical protein
MASSEPKPCPFCGGRNLKPVGDDKFAAYHCLDCEATGPNEYGKFTWEGRALYESTAEVTTSTT